MDKLQAITTDTMRYEAYTLVTLLIFGFIGFVLFWFLGSNGKEE